MATSELTESNFSRIALGPGIVLVDFWASWCVPCRMFGPVYEEAAERNPDITFGTVDTDAEVGLATEYEVRSVPTLMAIRDGVIVYARPGALPARVLDELIAKVRDLDMDDVRRRLPGKGTSRIAGR